MTTLPKKRKILLINRELQVGFMTKLAALVALGGLMSSIGLYLLAATELEAYSYRSHKLTPETQEALLLEIAGVNGLAVVLVAAAGSWLALHSLHRVAGPLWRFARVVRSVADGDLDVRTSLRQVEELQEFAAALGQMTESLAARIRRLRELHRELRKLAIELAPSAEQAPAIDALREKIAEAGRILDQFTIPTHSGSLEVRASHQADGHR
ncbi:MAG: methyl-accepting chemotaxis protein [Acidobacteria bacterium]|nr:methyl-accepting chemotaxis protein [Acidobacteriota bacterium]